MGMAAEAAGWTVRELPLADGGEGTLDALGGPNRSSVVTGPLGAPVLAAWRLEDGRAVIEMARASGLALAGGRGGNDPLGATTRGTGELIDLAIRDGAREVIVGVGGSATTDGGAGALQALAEEPFAARGVVVRVACDVRARFVDAATTFGPQKGASPRDIEVLSARLEQLADDYMARFGVDVRPIQGSGGAGGLAGGLAALGAEVLPGFDLVASAAGLDTALADADAVASGEGQLDLTSFDGKVVGGVAERARLREIPFLAIVGSTAFDAAVAISCTSLIEAYGQDAAWGKTAECIADATQKWLLGPSFSDPHRRAR
jgi:glycerate kinase